LAALRIRADDDPLGQVAQRFAAAAVAELIAAYHGARLVQIRQRACAG
jgi:hypothetical protein